MNATPNVPPRIFPSASEEAQVAANTTAVPQTEHPAYRLAFQDTDFLLREDLRAVRFQLELLKPELLLNEAKSASTFVMYGAARSPSPDEAESLLAAASTEAQKRVAQNLAAKSRYYVEARKLAQLVSQVEPEADGQRHFVVCSGGEIGRASCRERV